jgi:hypothetical protein
MAGPRRSSGVDGLLLVGQLDRRAPEEVDGSVVPNERLRLPITVRTCLGWTLTLRAKEQ